MASLNLQDDVNQSIQGRIQQSEELLGKGLMMPFNNVNSGSRKLMYSVMLEQRLPLMNPEVPFVATGYEDKFGEYSSSFIKNPYKRSVLAKIPKFSFKPDHHYFLITMSEPNENGVMDIDLIERASYKHISESYGYINDNSYLDSLKEDSVISEGVVIQKSNSFDEYNNRMDGTNLITCYMNTEITMEDGIIISDYAANYKLSSPLIKNIRIMISDNDIPLNLRGGENGEDIAYKSIPNIGESFNDGILYAQRREKKDEALFTQAKSRLNKIMISDEKYTVAEGTVVDINLHVNNPEKITTSQYFTQLNMYYQEQIRFANALVQLLSQYDDNPNYKMSYNLQKLYFRSKGILGGMQYSTEKVFSNVVMDIVVMEVIPMKRGDKMSNRYGGKGVVAQVRPQHLMPRLPSGDYVDCILNKDTVPNRQNFGQLFETSLTHIGAQIVEHISSETLDVGQSIDIVLKYLSMVSPSQYQSTSRYLSKMSDSECISYINSLSVDGGIFQSIDPISESMTIDKLAKIYEEFPFLGIPYLEVPIKGSNGTYRHVLSRRPIIAANQYFYRLKQYAEEKFSVTSLSSTNIRNENSRNKANNIHKALFARTPVKFGEMEAGDLMHAGSYIVAYAMMLYSTSPHGRRLTEQLFTGNPFNIDIRLDENSKSRSAEIINVYFKNLGLRLKFNKKFKQLIQPIIFEAIDFSFAKAEKLGDECNFITPIQIFDEDTKFEDAVIQEQLIHPIIFTPIDFIDDHPGVTDKDIGDTEIILKPKRS